MFELAYPLWLLALPLPLLLHRLPAYVAPQRAVRVPFFGALAALAKQTQSSGKPAGDKYNAWHDRLIALIWCAFVIAATKPQWLGEPIVETTAGRDLMIAVDISGSMDTRDFTTADGTSIDRLTAVKQLLNELVAQRDHDRLGLIVFGSAPFLQAPFTDDRTSWLTLLQETATGMAGQSTALGDAIGLGIRLFEASDKRDKVLLLFTDGNDTASQMPPIDAATVAGADGITVYPVAIGDPASAGQEALDSATLQTVAELTGGRFFQAIDRGELLQVYAVIEQLEPQQYDTVQFRPATSLHYVPVALALLLAVLYHALQAARYGSATRG